MRCNFNSRKSRQLFTTLISVFGLGLALINSPLAVAERLDNSLIARSTGGATLTGTNGQYTAKIVVNSSADIAWKVLTDYDNFENFLPNVSNSQLLTRQGNQNVFEQIYQIPAVVITKQVRIRLATTETYPKQIAFTLVEGDLNTLQGTWKIEPISAKQVLIQHQVNVDPGSTPSRPIFYSIYESSLKKSLEAIKKEAERRN